MLQVNFQVDDKVVSTIQKAGRETDIASIVIVIEDETMKQIGDPIPATGNLAADLEKVRSVLTASQLQSAYAVVYGGAADPVTVIVYSSDSAKAKERMLYSSGAAHLRDVVSKANTTRRTAVLPAHASSIDEIQTNLFQRKENEAGRHELMTESERRKEEIAKMDVAPQPTAMPGVPAPLSADAVKLLPVFTASLAKSGGMIVTFKVEDNQIAVDKQQTLPSTTEKNEQLAAAVAMLPAGEPRYVLTHYCEGAGKPHVAVMVYVCPGDLPPKVKMPYALCKATFLHQLAGHQLDILHRVDTSSANELPGAVRDSFLAVDFDKKPTKSDNGGKPPGARGPRMLI